MISVSGTIALMGSGELTATMVEVHKELLRGRTRAVFLDTPAGFQSNVDDISHKAVEYFRTRIRHPLGVVSCRSAQTLTAAGAGQSLHTLRQAGYILIGPGSPTYAVRQWRQTPIPDILAARITAGACLTAASAAALTVGRFTLPVYEIYKVGADLHWVDGLDLLGRVGCDLVVVPHWNNAEGGTHDTRYCYMGAARFAQLEAMLPPDTVILGLDEHTACILDIAAGEARVRGIGRVTLRCRGRETVFGKGEVIPLDVLRGAAEIAVPSAQHAADGREPDADSAEPAGFWNAVHELERRFQDDLDPGRVQSLSGTLMDFDALLWRAAREGAREEDLSQARELFREMLAMLGARFAHSDDSAGALIEALLEFREKLRTQENWAGADALRTGLERAGITVQDTAGGYHWELSGRQPESPVDSRRPG